MRYLLHVPYMGLTRLIGKDGRKKVRNGASAYLPVDFEAGASSPSLEWGRVSTTKFCGFGANIAP